MDLRRIRGFLLPRQDGEDEGFRQEMQRFGCTGLRVIGATEIFVAVFVLAAEIVTVMIERPGASRALISGRAWQAALVILVGLLTLGVAPSPLGRRRPVFLLCLSGWLSSAVIIGSSLALTPHASDEYIAVHITAIMLVAIAVCPLRPLDTFLLGASIWLAYLGAFIGGALASILDWSAWDPSRFVFLLMLTFVSTGLAAVLYAQHSTTYHAQQASVRLAQQLSAAPVRALLSENAISVGRLAAALTHELNTPLGALKSSIDTMLVVAAKQATASAEQQQRLVTVQAELRGSVNDGIQRLKNVIARLQRFIDLDHTERQLTDLNELLGNVAILLKPVLPENVKLEFDFHPVPAITCRPGQLTNVFSSLVSNAINAVKGEGRIVVSVDKVDSMARVRVRDNGQGMEECELETIFDPGFRVMAGRISTGNWSLFSSRQIVFEHGGEIQISSTPGKGTTVDVLLPM